MFSIHTNRSAMTALATLRQIDAQMQTTMQRISTGLRINDASDNAAYWSIATTLRSDIKAKGAVADTLGLSRAMTDIASASIKDYGGFTSVGYIEVDKGATTLIDPGNNSNGILTRDRNVTTAGGSAEIFYLLGSGTSGTARQITLDASTTADDLSGMVQAMDEIEQNLIDANAMLGVKAKGLERQEAFTKTLIEVSKKALGRLVDADMEEEIARLKALQVQKQLAIQALAIANSEPEMILQLFR